jgi:hypothetical protein
VGLWPAKRPYDFRAIVETASPIVLMTLLKVLLRKAPPFTFELSLTGSVRAFVVFRARFFVDMEPSFESFVADSPRHRPWRFGRLFEVLPVSIPLARSAAVRNTFPGSHLLGRGVAAES